MGLHIVQYLPSQPVKDSLHVTTLFHRDDAELILLIDPDQEGLGVIVENATALRPVALHASNLQVGVTRHEEEMVIHQLLPNPLIHSHQTIVIASQVSSKLGESIFHQFLNAKTLLPGDSRGETKSLDRAANTDPAMMAQLEERSLFGILSANPVIEISSNFCCHLLLDTC